MKRELFGHRSKKRSDSGPLPGKPAMNVDNPEGRAKDNPKGYEGKEHVKYKNPGFSSHKANLPKDEPHMKSKAGKEEMHEVEDNFHMDVPKQTKHGIPAHIKRTRMMMDMPDHDDVDPLHGNLVQKVGSKGIEDDSGHDEVGPNEMQKKADKESRKKMIVAVTKRKMKKGKALDPYSS